jgi:hydrogenase maturation protease
MVHAERPRVLVAGLGNIFLGDDAFGVEVVGRLAAMKLPESVRLLDVGTRSIHLAYELLEGDYDMAILIDLVSRGGTPGTLYVLEPDADTSASFDQGPDGHSIQPHQVLALVRKLGGRAGRVLVVGCDSSRCDPAAGVSPEVCEAIGEAVPLVLRLIASATAASVPLGES